MTHDSRSSVYLTPKLKIHQYHTNKIQYQLIHFCLSISKRYSTTILITTSFTNNKLCNYKFSIGMGLLVDVLITINEGCLINVETVLPCYEPVNTTFNLSSLPVFSEVRVTLSFFCMFCRSLFVSVSFFFWPLCYLFFVEIRILITPSVSSNSS